MGLSIYMYIVLFLRRSIQGSTGSRAWSRPKLNVKIIADMAISQKQNRSPETDTLPAEYYKGVPRSNANSSVISFTFVLLNMVYLYIMIYYQFFEIQLLFQYITWQLLLCSNTRILGKRPWPRLKKDFKDEILCHTCSKIMSIMISFESIMTHLVNIVYSAG